jgi:hypothetical protein
VPAGPAPAAPAEGSTYVVVEATGVDESLAKVANSDHVTRFDSPESDDTTTEHTSLGDQWDSMGGDR